MAVHKVENLSKVDTTRYVEGDLFISKRSAALLLNGKLEPIVRKNDVQKMIDYAIKKVKEDV